MDDPGATGARRDGRAPRPGDADARGDERASRPEEAGSHGHGPATAGPVGPRDEHVRPAEVPARAASSGVLLAAGFAGVALCTVVLGSIAEAVRAKESFALDQYASPLLHSIASPTLDAVMRTATFVGSNPVVVPATGVVVAALAWRRRPREALYLAVVAGGSILLNGALKGFFARPRPKLPWASVLPDYSFPSGHSMASMAVLVAIALIVWQVKGRRWGLPALVVALAAASLVGVSRVYLGYHYVTDVVGGFLAALLWLAVVAGSFRGSRMLLARVRGSRAARAA